MSVESVREYLKKWKLDGNVREFEESSATVELAAKAVGCEPARIAKSMSFLVDGKPVIILLAGDVKTDNTKFKAQFHTKAVMIRPDELPQLVGHAMGGVCPFALPQGVRVCLDASLKDHDTVYPAAGAGNACLRLTLAQLEQLSGGEWVDVCTKAL